MKIIRDRYELRRSLGSGGFGEVYLAFDRELNREVAIKRLLGSVDNEAFKRYREHEVKIHAQLESKFVVPLYESFQWEDSFYLVFALMDHSLARYREPVEWKQVMEWV